MNAAKLWFSLNGRVGRTEYVLSGIGLMALKYAIDAAIVYGAERHILTPLEFLSPLFTTREKLLGHSDVSGMTALIAVALPFLWIGVSMSVRRAVDAAWSPFVGLLFVVPFLNFIVMLALSIAPSKSSEPWTLPNVEASNVDRVKSALLGVVLGMGIAVVMMGVSVGILREYTGILFFATPFLMGAASGHVYNHRPRDWVSTAFVGVASVGIATGALLLFALEGAICIAMAFPFVAGAGFFGALVGRAIAVRGRRSSMGLFPLLLTLPFASAMGAFVPPMLSEREVVTVVEVDAPPSEVWEHVVSFAEIPPPPEALFRLGVAYPIRAEIHGSGAGAVRHCEFSTGPFVEPITVWEPPSRLSFGVDAQPMPMHEWSPYRHVHPPHLDGYLRTTRGEFRLIPLAGGRTRLEGSTWYTLDLAPNGYWAIWTDLFIHMIHRRVLDHIARETQLSASET